MTKNTVDGLFLKTCLIVIMALTLVFAASAAPKDDNKDLVVKRGAEEIHLVKHDLSPPLRNIPPAPFVAGVKRIHPVKPLPMRPRDPNKPVTGGLDPGLQTFMGTMAMPTPASNFMGVGKGLGTWTPSSAPPDTNGDIGPNHYVQTVNTAMAIFSKTGTVLWGPNNINTLFSGFGGGCQTNNDGDPTVTYDQMNDRWIITQFSVSTTPYLECVAVSQTGDPTGAYYRFSYSFGTSFNDYPKTGIWGGDYYISYNMFANGSSFSGGKVCSHQGSKLRAGQANTMQCFDESGGGLLAADIDGSAQPPAGAPEHVISFGTNSLNVWRMKVDWTTPANSTFSGPTSISVNAFTIAASVPQPGTTNKLDSLSDRMMNRLAYRNRAGVESFVMTHSVSASGIAGIRWYELRTSNSATTTPTLFQQGTYSPDTNHRWMGSIAMDKDGNIAAGYSVSSSSIKPSIRFAGRLSSDTAGQFLQGETSLIAGAGSQTGTLTRWGDYSSMNIDPIDDCTFWYTTEYLTADGTFNWSTRIGSFKFSTCGGAGGDVTPPTTSLTAPASGASVAATIAVSANASDNVGVTQVQFYLDGTTLIGTDTTSPYSVSWDTTSVANGSHTLTSKAYDAAGNVGTSTAVSVTVSNSGSAAYDSTLKAPKCGTVGTFCDSGTLLNGRATLGPEPNYPNTINNSCSDGTSGAFHSDESNDRIKVATTDGSTFAAGKTVKVEATVWAYSTFSSDKLDLYYTANANSPSWTLIGTLSPTVAGTQTLSANYTLPSGSLQAVRARFRYNGSAAACGTGSYDDHDDLIFGVGAGSDTTPPTTSITSPTSGSTVSGTITISANASDNIGVTKVDFYVDGSTLIGSDTTSPYSISWNTASVVNGSHALSSKAYDAAGNTGTSANVSITVNNSASCGTSSQLLLNPGFESGNNGNWTVFSSKGSTSVINNGTGRPARTGSWKTWLNGYGSSSTEYIYQQITVPSAACSAQLVFWVRIDTAETTTTTQYDKLQVQILNTSGSVLATLATYSNLNANSLYVQKTLDLAAYKGQTIRVRFYGTEDTSLQTSFVIDDTAMNVTQ